MPKFSINLLVYNGLKFLPQCVESVLNQSYQDFNFLIIDNNSNDGSGKYLLDMQSKFRENPRLVPRKFTILFNEENVGFAAGHNQGIRLSNSDYILCLNQDVILDKNFLRNAVEILNSDDTIGSLQPQILRLKEIKGNFEKIDTIDTTGLIIFKNRRIINRGQGEKVSSFPEGQAYGAGKFQVSGEVFGVDGAAPIYRRQSLEDVKIFNEYFDEDFFTYKEDVDLAWRMRLYGWKAVYVPGVLAWHVRGAGDNAKTKYWDIIQERRKIAQFSKYYSFKNQRLMQVKNELSSLLLWHLPWWLPKEIASWIYVLIFERYTVKAFRELIKQMPKAWGKRKIIMKNKKIGIKNMNKWFA